MTKPLGKQSVRSAIEDLYPIMPTRFSTLHFHILISMRIGRPDIFHDTILRKMRELKEEGKINFRNINKAKSLYEKITVQLYKNETQK
jgi:hypothetical protein